MKILLINQYAGSSSMGMEIRPNWMARQWQKDGNEVLVISSSWTHLRRWNPEVRGLWSRQKVDGIDHLFLRGPKYKSSGGIGRVLGILLFRIQLQILVPFLVRLKPDVVIASSTHPVDVRPCCRIAKKSGAVLVYEVHDLWPLTPILLGGYSPRHPFIRFMQREEDFACGNSDLVVSLLPNTFEYLREHGMSADAWKYIPNGIRTSAENEGLDPTMASAIADIKSRYSFVIGYAGTMGIANRLDALLENAFQLNEMNVAIAMLGNGPLSQSLRARYESASNVYFFDAIAPSQVQSFLLNMDSLYIGWEDSPLYRFGISANKIFEYMYAAKPVLFLGEVASNPIVAADSGIVVSQPGEIPKAVHSLMTMTFDQIESMSRRSRAFVENEHEQVVLSKRFANEMARESQNH